MKPHGNPLQNLLQYSLTEEGEKTLLYKSIDYGLNQETPKLAAIKIDKTYPEITISSPSSGGSYNDNDKIPLTVTATDTISGIDTKTITLDSTSDVSNSSTVGPLLAGTHAISVLAKDKAGRSSTKDVSFNVTVATTTTTTTTSSTVSSTTTSTTTTTTTSTSTTTTTTILTTTTITTTTTSTTNCTYGISPQSQNYNSNGGSGIINISSTSGQCWSTVTNNCDWVVIDSWDSSSVNYSVASNLAISQRTCTISIGYHSFTVTQNGVSTTKQAELKAGAVTCQKQIKAGRKLNVTAIAKNIGGENASSFKIAFYLSSNSDKSIDGDTLIGEKSVSGLGKKKAKNIFYTWKVPTETTKGSYYIKAFWDSENVLSESNEENNIGVSEKTVTIK